MSAASVTVDGRVVGEIGRGLVLLVGVARGDNVATAERLARKCAELRLFPNSTGGRFDLALPDCGGEALVVSQFTLLADVRKGRRPSFVDAESPELAAFIVEAFAATLTALGISTASGEFGAHMDVALVNDGPVTLIVDSADLERPRRRGAPGGVSGVAD